MALAKADAALAMNYADGDAWVYRGLALEQQGKHQEALEVLSTVSREPEIADSDLGPLVAEAEGRAREAAAESAETRASRQPCSYIRKMSAADTVRFLNAVSGTLSQANKCVGSIRRNCNNWTITERKRSFSACWGVVTKAAKIQKPKCSELASGNVPKWLWIGTQSLYLWHQMELLETECPH
jgi:tetratricopeptide (TPR) repeat protein